MINKFLLVASFMSFSVLWAGPSIASDNAHYQMHKKKLYVPCVYIVDADEVKYAVNAKFQQLGSSRNFRLESYTKVATPDEDCPQMEYPVQLPVEEEDEDVVQLPVEEEDEDAVQLPVVEDKNAGQQPENNSKGCPNENANGHAKENHPECTY